MRTLDSVWEENGRPEWRLLKLDVEGNELEVLKGSGDLFASQPPIACIVEFNVPSLSQTSGNLDKLWNFFIQRNYQACNLDGQPREKPSKGISDVLFLLS